MLSHRRRPSGFKLMRRSVSPCNCGSNSYVSFPCHFVVITADDLAAGEECECAKNCNRGGDRNRNLQAKRLPFVVSGCPCIPAVVLSTFGRYFPGTNTALLRIPVGSQHIYICLYVDSQHGPSLATVAWQQSLFICDTSEGSDAGE